MNKHEDSPHSPALDVHALSSDQLFALLRTRRGINGHLLTINSDGDLVERLPCDDDPTETYDIVYIRNMSTVLVEYEKIWQQVWRYSHRVRAFNQYAIDCELHSLRDVIGGPLEEPSSDHLRAFDDIPPMSDSEWGILQGKLGALAWVMGSAWDEAFDT